MAPKIFCSVTDEKHYDDKKSDARQRDEKGIIAFERSKGGAGVCHINEIEKSANDHSRLIRLNRAQDKIFRDLIEHVKRERDEKDKLHRDVSVSPGYGLAGARFSTGCSEVTTASHRSHKSG